MVWGYIPVFVIWLEHGGHTSTTCMTIKRIIWPVQTLLTFCNNLLNSDLVSPDSKVSSNEISACMTGPGAATSSSTSSRTRPGADQLPTRIKELPHAVEMTGGVFAASVTDTQMSCLFPVRGVIALADKASQILSLEKSLFAAWHWRQRCLCHLWLCWDNPDFFFGGKFPICLPDTSQLVIARAAGTSCYVIE